MTIVGAIKKVLSDNKPRTAKMIYDEIVARNLYIFGAKKPEAVVNGEIRCHCEGISFPSASPVKHFKVVGQEGKHNLYLTVDADYNETNLEDNDKYAIVNDDTLPEEK